MVLAYYLFASGYVVGHLWMLGFWLIEAGENYAKGNHTLCAFLILLSAVNVFAIINML